MDKQNEKKLAIVIPAFKKIFFKETLESVCNQTNKAFTVYIGDDCSPHNFTEIIEPFRKSIPVVYKRFDENLGAADLVAHWHRCIDMVESEQWIWLFSDDDIMEPNCVEKFYTELNKGTDALLYHFNVTRIDQHGELIFPETDYPLNLSAFDFINKIINFRLRSYVIEYIFNYNHFKDAGGFQKFDLGWGSDHATWLKLSFDGNIRTIPHARVKWRSSGYNITSINHNKILSNRKRLAELDFYQWLVDFFGRKSIRQPFSSFSATRWFLQGVIIDMDQYGFQDVPKWINKFSTIQGGYIRKISCYFLLIIYTLLFLSKKGTRWFKIQLQQPGKQLVHKHY